jgi:hypothetical protein
MFNENHYIPILRWKAAEKEALEKLDTLKRKHITPLIELIMPQPKNLRDDEERLKTPKELLDESIESFKKKLPKIPEEILKCWGTSPCFIDPSLIHITLRAESLIQISAIGSKLNISLIPVINLNSDVETQAGVISLGNKNDSGLCLRLFRSDIFNQSSLENKINNLLSTHKLSEKNVDLLLDFQITDELCIKIFELVIPNISKWRTFSVASGAFPQDLTQFSKPDLYRIPRNDWKCWLSQMKSNKLKRNPSFADYTIQHPIYKEPLPGANPSASIRYALNDQWIIMRGEGLRGGKSKGFAQYPANAKLLVQQAEFFGADFSFGDAYIANKAKDLKTKETGTPRTWLRAGINHHLACTADQIANLPEYKDAF